MEGLGRLFNVVPTADNVEVNVQNCSAVTFICVGADTYTVQEATSAAGAGARDLDVIDRYYASTSAAGAAAWTVTERAADAAVVVASGIVALHVDVKSLSDGYTYLRCASSAAGLVIAITHDLNVQRSPVNLPAPAA